MYCPVCKSTDIKNGDKYYYKCQFCGYSNSIVKWKEHMRNMERAEVIVHEWNIMRPWFPKNDTTN